MTNAKLLYLLDILTAISFIICVGSLFIGSRGLHQSSGWIFIILAIIHTLIHTNWFICMTKNFFKK